MVQIVEKETILPICRCLDGADIRQYRYWMVQILKKFQLLCQVSWLRIIAFMICAYCN